MSAPFDKSLPSPIGRVRELQARAPGAVVGVTGMTSLQTEAYVPTPAEENLSMLVMSEDPPDLVVVSGSAGGGKSALIDRIDKRHPDLFDVVIQDATHSDSPSSSQADDVARFFAPFTDSAQGGPPGGPRIIAANTGMLIQLFRQLRENGNAEFSLLEATLKYRLGISREPPGDAPWRLAVLNLDLRPTAGEAGLLRSMFELLDFTNATGLLGGAPRCDTCAVRKWCPVRTNSILAHQVGSEAIDILAERVAIERARHAGPRQLYDLAARALTGGDNFDENDDPCDAVAAAAERKDARWVWQRLLPRALFQVGGELGARVAELDPSLQPSFDGHTLLARAGIRPAADAAELLALDPGGAEAVATAATYVESGEADHEEVGRALIVADFLREPRKWTLGDTVSGDFATLLSNYDYFSRDGEPPFKELVALGQLLERALARTFGVLHGETPYIPVKAYDPRDPSRIFVKARLRYEDGTYRPAKDPARLRDPDGAELAGYTPLVLTIGVGGVDLILSLPLYRLLRQAERSTLASTADLERFFGLRHAVEALARTLSVKDKELVVERPGTSPPRRYTVRRAEGLGQDYIAVEELGR